MENKYTKINENTARMEITKVEEIILDLDQLEYDKDSLLRTIQNNLNEVNQKNAEIQNMINELDEKIFEVKKIGVKTKAVEIELTEIPKEK